MQLIVCRDAEETGTRAAEWFLMLAGKTLQSRRRFTVALSGGSTPRRLYSLLAGETLRRKVPWKQVKLFWGDERFVAPNHRYSNYRMVSEALLEKVPIPAGNVFPIPTLDTEAAAAATRYEQTLRSFFRLRKGEFPRFDLVLLGMGEDGHTASLFPGTTALQENVRLVAANYVGQLEAWRITLTLPVFNNARNIVFLVNGGNKARALQRVLEGPARFDRLPARKIRPKRGNLIFLVDQEAARCLARTDQRAGQTVDVDQHSVRPQRSG